MGVEQHLVGLLQIGRENESAAVGELDVSDLQFGPLPPRQLRERDVAVQKPGKPLSAPITFIDETPDRRSSDAKCMGGAPKHGKVLNIEWLGNRVELVGFRRGEWKAELLAMGEPTGDARRSPS
jgi:hypothetical protein